MSTIAVRTPRTIGTHSDVTLRADNVDEADDDAPYVAAVIECDDSAEPSLRLMYASAGVNGPLADMHVPVEHLEDLIAILESVRSQRDRLGRAQPRGPRLSPKKGMKSA